MPRKQLIGFGTAFGKFTKTKQFRLHVTCLDYVAQHAQHDSSCNRSSTGPRVSLSLSLRERRRLGLAGGLAAGDYDPHAGHSHAG